MNGDIIALSDNWLGVLEEQRKLGKEIEAEETARNRYKAKSKAYWEWLALSLEERKALKNQRARARADGFIRDLRPVGIPEEQPEPPRLSDLALAIRCYLDQSPHDACQPQGWLGATLWAFNLYPDKPAPSEVRASIAALGGDRYLRSFQERARGAA